MTVSKEKPTAPDSIDLKDPALAGFLAWLLPGLGHAYQRRWAKAALFFICIMGTFLYGCYLGGSSTLGWGRVVYFSGRQGDRRLPYLCQVGVGLPALPALIQANRMNNGRRVWLGGMMAPPRMPGSVIGPDDPNAGQPDINELHHELHRYFEFGTVFTMIAGLLNILAIYDAWCGPVFSPSARKDAEDSQQDPPSDEDRPPGESGTEHETKNREGA